MEPANSAQSRLRILIGLGVLVIALAGWWSFSSRELSPNELRQLPQAALETRAKSGPDPFTALLILGERQADEGAIDEAVDSFRRARDLDPANPDALAPYILITAGRTAPGWAESVLEEMAKAQPDSSAVELALGQLYELEGFHEPAGPHFQRATELNPQDSEAHFQLGKWYGAIGDTGNALSSMKQAVRLAPKLARYYLSLADLQIHLTLYADAEANLRQARRWEGDPLLLKYHTARLLLADRPTKERRGDAMALLREASESAPDWELPRLALGQALIADGQFLEGITHLRDSVKGAHPDPQVLATLARAYYRLRNKKEGDRHIARYESELAFQKEAAALKDKLRTSPNAVAPRLRRARELLSSGSPLQALRVYRDILRIDPQHPEALAKSKLLTQVPK